MNTRDAVALISGSVPRTVATWADLGAGGGTFTSALVQILEPGSRVYAIDRDASAVDSLRRLVARPGVEIIASQADFAAGAPLPDIGAATLDGILLANALHFVRDAASVLARLVTLLRSDGRVVIVEYDQRPASRWVPYPISASQLPALASAASLSSFIVVAQRPSRFSGMLYAACAARSS